MTQVILADTSAWVEFDRATGSAVDRRLTGLLEDNGPLAVTEPVVMEVVAGARTDGDGASLRRLLGRCTLLPVDPAADFDATIRIFRLCRRGGVTPGGMLDCLVASVLRRHGATLLAANPDRIRVARVMGIELDTVFRGR